MSDDKRKRVFISHASVDAKKAGELCKAIEGMGYPCWIAPRDIAPGKQYGEEIIRGIESTDGLVLVLSKKSNESPHVRDEAERAKHYGKRIIPIRIEDIQPSKSLEFYIATSQWIDAFGAQWESGVDRLAGTIAEMAGEEAPPPSATAGASPTKKPTAMIGIGCTLALIIGIGVWATNNRAGKDQEAQPHPNEDGNDVTQQVSDDRGVVRLKVDAGVHPNASELIPGYHALVIGINQYANFGTKGWSDLQTARNDARQIADQLNTEYGFDVRLLVDEAATRDTILQELDAIATSYPDDAILIYYAGHGYYKEDVGQGYWIPSDARKNTEDGTLAKQDWIWNSTIQEILNSTKSKHVLMIADSCFSGSLFRGAADEELMAREGQWYRRAIAKDSRYLITSGDMEPVMDGGGGGHSVFARTMLDYLRNAEALFSASDLAQSVREQVSTQTGQLVRMGHLPASSHAGGEFVFLRKTKDLPEGVDVVDADEPVVPISALLQQAKPRGRTQSFQAALDLHKSGITNTAINVLASWGDDKYARALTAELEQKTKQVQVNRIHKLIEDIERRKQSADDKADAWKDYARPRVLALLPPEVPDGVAVDPSLLRLLNVYMTTELSFSGKMQIVERDALESVLEELNLGASGLADERASLTVGKLLPASLVLMGDLFPSENDTRIILRLIDTETTRILTSFKGSTDAENDLADVVEELGENITKMVVRARPLTARILNQDGDTLRAGAGQFHGTTLDTEFTINQRSYPDVAKPDDFRDTKVGTAVVIDLGEETSDLKPTFTNEGNAPDVNTLWVKEKRN
jgi:hypothetical protein